MSSNDNNIIKFYEWECPECEELNPVQDHQKNFKGTAQCRSCHRAFQLKGLYQHGFVQENEA
jgi:transcription elongation factor Elf1